LLEQDSPLELLELRPGFDADLLDQCLVRTPVGRERFGLTPGVVERQHEKGPEAFSERMTRKQLFELGYERFRASACQVGFDPFLDDREAQLFEADDLVLSERFGWKVDERQSSPDRERLGEECRPHLAFCVSCFGD
jgi:hypothetical protein